MKTTIRKPAPKPMRCDPNCIGIIKSHSGLHGYQIERCDECNLYDDDDQAVDAIYELAVAEAIRRDYIVTQD